MGRGRTEVWPHPAHSFSHPPCTPRTPLTWHHVSVREQTALLSVTGSNFLLPSSVPPSFLPLPHTLFFPLSPLSSSLFVLLSQTTKGRQSEGWRHPSSLWPLKKKRQLPLTPILPLELTTHRHMHMMHPQLYIGFKLRSTAVPMCIPWSSLPWFPPHFTHKHIQKDTDTLTATKLAVKCSFINVSLGGFLTDTQGDVTLVPWLTATTQIHSP